MDPQFLAFLFVCSAVCVGWKSGPVLSAWLRARRSAAPIGILSLWGVYFRNAPLEAVVDAHISAREAGVPLSIRQLVDHARAGGDVRAAAYAYIETLRSGTAVEFERVCELDLGERRGEDQRDAGA